MKIKEHTNILILIVKIFLSNTHEEIPNWLKKICNHIHYLAPTLQIEGVSDVRHVSCWTLTLTPHQHSTSNFSKYSNYLLKETTYLRIHNLYYQLYYSKVDEEVARVCLPAIYDDGTDEGFSVAFHISKRRRKCEIYY